MIILILIRNRWIVSPLKNQKEIENRQDVISFYQQPQLKELQTALEKVHDRKTSVYEADKFINSSPLLANYIDLFKLPVLFIIYAFDEHPELPARMKNACTQIEYDLKNHHFRPAMKARIKHDLKVMQANLAKEEKTKQEISKIYSQAYKDEMISERHRHRYEVNNEYRDVLEDYGAVICGTSPDDFLVEMIELKDHPWFLGCQFHPEFKSRPNAAHPLFKSFIKAAKERKESRN